MSQEVNLLRELLKLRSAIDIRPITPNDSVDIPICESLSIASGGVIKLTTENDNVVTVTLPSGVIPLRVKRVWATGLTASGISALYN